MTATRQTSLAVNGTHEVFNEPDPLTVWNVFTSDTPLVEAAQWAGAGDADDWLTMVGEVVGSDEYVEFGFEANRHIPELRTHDRLGHRIDRVDYHPSYHRLMEKALELGVHSRPRA